MQLKGTFDRVDFEDVLEWLETAGRTGALDLENDRFRKSLYFVSGAIVGVASTEPADSLTAQVAERGLLSAPQVEAALHVQRRTGRALVDVLHKTGAVSDADLEAAIERQASEAVLSVFLWQGGSFCFREGELPADLAAAVSLEASGLLPEGRRRAERVRTIRGSLPGPTARLHRVVDMQEIPIGSPLEEQILHELEQPQTVLSLMLNTRASEYAVLEVLDRLIREHALMAEHTSAAPAVVGVAAQQEFLTMASSQPALSVSASSECTMSSPSASRSALTAFASASGSDGGGDSSQASAVGLLEACGPASRAGGNDVGGRGGGSGGGSGSAAGRAGSRTSGAGGSGAPREQSGPLRAQELLTHARRQMELRSYDEALELFRRAERADTSNESLRTIRRGAETVYCEVLYRSELPPDAKPFRVLGLDQLPAETSDDARALLARIDGSLPVRSLVSENREKELAMLVLLRDLKRSGLLHLAESPSGV